MQVSLDLGPPEKPEIHLFYFLIKPSALRCQISILVRLPLYIYRFADVDDRSCRFMESSLELCVYIDRSSFVHAIRGNNDRCVQAASDQGKEIDDFLFSPNLPSGSTRATDAERRALAATSHAWNLYVFFSHQFICHPLTIMCSFFLSTNAKFKAILPEYAVTPMKALPNMGPPATPSSKDKSTVLANSSTSLQTNPDGDAPVGNGIGKRDEGGWFISRWRREVMGGVVLLLISWALMRVLEL